MHAADRHPGPQRLLDLAGARRVGTGAPARQGGEDLVDRAGLQGEPHLYAGQFAAQCVVAALDAGQVVHEPVLGGGGEGGGQGFAEARGRHRAHRGCPAAGGTGVVLAAATIGSHASVSSAKSAMSPRASSRRRARRPASRSAQSAYRPPSRR
ncbi:hypothetical protein SVIOM342S_01612 [Streptomyces violaceorubidus]